MTEDLLLFSEEHLHEQLKSAPYTSGFYMVHFYSEKGLPSRKATGEISEFYLYPSGGTLRDRTFNLVFYDSQFDMYRGFKPPHLKKNN
jgi:hypothetical protein